MLTSNPTYPTWEDLELHSHHGTDTLELFLTHQGRPVAFSHARDLRHQGLRWLDPPTGLDWARALLREATNEWLRLREADPAPARATPLGEAHPHQATRSISVPS